MTKSIHDLQVWRESIEMVAAVYEATETFPRSEIFGMTAQLRRAAVSVSCNIAEGQGSITLGEWKQFLGHARGSLNEVETLIAIADRLTLFTSPSGSLRMMCQRIGRQLNGLIRYVDGRQAKS